MVKKGKKSEKLIQFRVIILVIVNLMCILLQ